MDVLNWNYTLTRPGSSSSGRFATENRRRRGLGKPETLDFLGFTHYCAKDRKGRFQLGRKPVSKRMARTLKRIKEELRRRMHDGVDQTARWLGQVLDGWLNYFAVPTSYRFLGRFVQRLKVLWLRTLRRRSQKDRYSGDRMERLTAKYWAHAGNPTPVAEPTICRQLTRRRSRVHQRACTDLCGGSGATRFPTAIASRSFAGKTGRAVPGCGPR